MSEQPIEPEWQHQQSDRLGSKIMFAHGLIRMVGANGAEVELHTLGPNALPLDRVGLVAAISLVVGSELVALPAISTGWTLLDDPPRVRVGDDEWTLEEATQYAGRLGTAAMAALRGQRAQVNAAVRAKAERLAGVAGPRYDALPDGERVMWEAAAWRDLTAP